MAFRVRPVRDLDEYARALGAIGHYFGWEPTGEDADRFAQLLPPERFHAVLDDGAIVAGAGAFPFALTVPGGPVPCAGVTIVGVLPTHRRRGLLRRLMEAQLADIRERGEPLAALWASEETIYGRYGYGVASLCGVDMKLPRAHAGLREPAPGRGRVRLVSTEEALRTFPRVYDRVARTAVGFPARSRRWWELRTLRDAPERRGGAGPVQRALLEVDGRPVGYALYRIAGGFEGAVNVGSVRIAEAIADGPEATHDLWSYLLSIDWLGEVRADLLPLDHPLFHVALRPNLMQLKVADGLWLRLVDVETALAARAYAGDGRATVEVVADPLFPDNVDRFTVEGGAAKRSRRRPDVRLEARSLASAYLGGFTFAGLAAAGLAEEGSRGGLERADALFRTDRAPWCPEIF